jgi:hypothetical protein
MGLDEGLRQLTRDTDPLLGRDAANPCHAQLEFSPNATARMKLIGATDRVFDDEAGNYVVHGVTTDGVPCTLLDCFTGPR